MLGNPGRSRLAAAGPLGHDGPVPPRSTPPWWAAVLLVLSLVLVPAAAAAAHSILVGSTPSAGEDQSGVAQVELRFAAELSPDGDHAVVARTDDGEIPAVGYELTDPATLLARFDAPLPADTRAVAWEVVAADGHRERGVIPAAGTAAEDHDDEDGPPVLAVGVGLAVVVAVAAVRLAWTARRRRPATA